MIAEKQIVVGKQQIAYGCFVKYTMNRITFHGVVDSINPNPKDLTISRISDAILPASFLIKKDLLQPLSMNYVLRFLAEKEREAREYSDKLPSGVHVGKLLTFDSGEGITNYVVTEVDSFKKTCRVEWRGFNPERWVDKTFGTKKEVPISVAASLL